MGYAPIGRVEEALGEDEGGVLAPIPDTLEPIDYTILGLRFRHTTTSEIATLLGCDTREVVARIRRPAFTVLQREAERGIVATVVAGGSNEPITLAKLAAPGAMRRIIATSKTATDPRVALQANKEVLRMAGAEPPQRVQFVSPEQILDQMTQEELEAYAATRRWPGRFREQLAHLVQTGGGNGEGHTPSVTVTRSVTVRERRSIPAAGGAQSAAPPPAPRSRYTLDTDLDEHVLDVGRGGGAEE